MYRSLIAASLAIAVAIATAASAQSAPPVPPSAASSPRTGAPDYADAASWLCRPGRADVCSAAYSVAVVAANGTVIKASFPPSADAKVDCFYVYPTVSTDPGGNSDMTADPAETNVAKIQFAPFRSVCRTYAPLYRQVTLAALRAVLTGAPTTADRAMAYDDVRAAWRQYLKTDNHGRGVILIGHSQGSGLLKALIHNEIDGKPIATQLIAAYIPGTNIMVPEGKDVGGDFASTPLCRSATQTGCVATWVSFRDETPPPADTRFGRATEAGMAVACTNPAALGGGRGALKPLLPSSSSIVDNAAVQPAWVKGKTIDADFVSLPGLLSAECRTSAGASYLAVRTDADPADPRTDKIAGDVVASGAIRYEWGLHLIDVNEALGNLTALAASQSAAWLKSH